VPTPIKGKNGGTLQRLNKGETGNPNGRPKKLPELDKLLADVLGEEKDGLTAAEAILKKLRQMATGGNLRAAEILLDRGYGKPRQSVDSTVTLREFPNPIIEIPNE
jgi:hypothetical protein